MFGKFTASTVFPEFIYPIILPGTKSAISRCASSVLPPTCGVKITFEIPFSSVSKPPLALGSTGKTSTAAPYNFPEFKASFKA